MRSTIINYAFKKNLCLLLVIIGCALLFNYINNTKKPEFLPLTLAQEYMKNVHVIHYTDKGEIKDGITASYWEFIPKDEKSNLLDPVLYINKLNGVIWHIKAGHGTALHKHLYSKITQLNLWDKVVASRPQTTLTEPIRITGESMRYFPENEYITSDEYVKLAKPGLILTGIGFHGYLNKNWVEILSDVTTIYTNNNP